MTVAKAIPLLLAVVMTSQFATQQKARADDQRLQNLETEIEVETTFEIEHNTDLDDDEETDVGVVEPEIGLSFIYEPNDVFAAELGISLNHEAFLIDEADEEDGELKLEIDEAFFTLTDPVTEGFAMQIGRQRIRDEKREWLLDENLDGVKLSYEWRRLTADFSVSRERLVDKDLLNNEENPRVNNYVALADYALSDDHVLGAYLVARDDRADDDFQPLHLGLRSYGEIAEDWTHWLDLGHVTGRDAGRDLAGYAADLGLTKVFDLSFEPSLTLAYAWGSGDSDPDDDTDRAYRQTGLQDNSSNFNGLPRFKYYGELFDPELSNLHVFTFGAGLRNEKRSSVDLVYHHYRQVTRTNEIRDSGIDGDLEGGSRSKHLGDEIDLIVGFRDILGIPDLGADAAIGYFLPGNAFSEETNDPALFLRLDLALAL